MQPLYLESTDIADYIYANPSAVDLSLEGILLTDRKLPHSIELIKNDVLDIHRHSYFVLGCRPE
jgi:hypothetical protein